MKILNEKSLTYFANSGAPADKEGYLHKKGKRNKGFRRRWFVLRGNLLFYYENKGDKDILGLIVLEECIIDSAEDIDNLTFMIKFTYAGTRIYCLKASSQESKDLWVKALSCAGFNYVKRVVNDLLNKLQVISKCADANVIEDAVQDSQNFGRIDNDSIRSDNTEDRPTSFIDYVDMNSDIMELENGNFIRPTSIISNMKIITWPHLQIRSFAEMHEFIREQINAFSK